MTNLLGKYETDETDGRQKEAASFPAA